jgi:AcrR family transcriptional regulator
MMAKKKEINPLNLRALRTGPTPGERKRAEILESVVAILAERGLDELTFESVGKATGMARSHVVYYFKSRDELVLAALRYCSLSAGEIIDSQVGQAKDWQDALALYVEGNFEWIRRNPAHATIYLLMYYLARLNPVYRKLHSEIRQAGADRLEAVLNTRPGAKGSQTALAKAIQALVTGQLLDAMTTTKGALEERRTETLAAVEAFMRGQK